VKNISQEISDTSTYDYVFAGGGMAALSMVYYINQSSLKNKKILIVDRDQKNTNDHTFCFWESGDSPYETIVMKKWNKVWFHGTDGFSELMPLKNYSYKMISGLDFYKFIFKSINQNPNITFLLADVLAIKQKSDPIVETSNGSFTAREYVFDSVFRPKYDKKAYNNLMQHFLGWVIETPKPYFKIDEPTLFDFRIEQKNEFRFVYVLPISPTKALIEFTIFSDNLIEKAEYEFYLKEYIENTLKVDGYKINHDEYQVSETEYGIVPMSDEPHDMFPAPKVVRIGTAGGYVKASSGYSFQRSQTFLQKIVKAIEAKQNLTNTLNNNWKNYLDSVLLNVMAKRRTNQAKIFTLLFKKNGAPKVLKFLSEETSLVEDIGIMNSVQKLPFIKSAIRVIFNKFI
jgi:lycopene beta-cyclase